MRILLINPSTPSPKPPPRRWGWPISRRRWRGRDRGPRAGPGGPAVLRGDCWQDCSGVPAPDRRGDRRHHDVDAALAVLADAKRLWPGSLTARRRAARHVLRRGDAGGLPGAGRRRPRRGERTPSSSSAGPSRPAQGWLESVRASPGATATACALRRGGDASGTSTACPCPPAGCCRSAVTAPWACPSA